MVCCEEQVPERKKFPDNYLLPTYFGRFCIRYNSIRDSWKRSKMVLYLQDYYILTRTDNNAIREYSSF
ncbi:unnamed protein product [Rhizophagus irregularis]|nr:unnamed protein product [Rhizophagus irregularis]CAB5375175.1 unnamed protein product [Rhizophagus irregularis]